MAENQGHDPDFEALLGRPAGEATKPGLCEGVFQLTALDLELGKSAQKKTPYIEFKCRIDRPIRVDNQAALKALGDLSQKVERVTFYLTDGSFYRLDEFLELLNIKTKGRTYRETVPEVINKTFYAEYEAEEIERDGKPTGDYRYRARSFAAAT